MRLPSEVSEMLARAGGGEPLAAARALTDLAGNLGETYTVCDGQALHLFSKKVGEHFQARRLALSDVGDCQLREDVPFFHLKLRAAGEDFTLKFSILDRGDLGRLVALWTKQRPARAEPTPAAATAPASSAPSAVANAAPSATTAPAADTPAPLVLFCAAVIAMGEVDGSASDGETAHLTDLVENPAAIAAGRAWLAQHSVETLLAAAGAALNDDQKLCLMANLIEVAMVDGLLRGREQALIASFQSGLGISDNDYQAIFDILVVKNNLSVFPA